MTAYASALLRIFGRESGSVFIGDYIRRTRRARRGCRRYRRASTPGGRGTGTSVWFIELLLRSIASVLRVARAMPVRGPARSRYVTPQVRRSRIPRGHYQRSSAAASLNPLAAPSTGVIRAPVKCPLDQAARSSGAPVSQLRLPVPHKGGAAVDGLLTRSTAADVSASPLRPGRYRAALVFPTVDLLGWDVRQIIVHEHRFQFLAEFAHIRDSTPATART